MNKQDRYDRVYLNMAEEWSSLSHCERKKVGAIIERPNFYPYMSAWQNLQLVCKIKEISYDKIDEKLKEVNLFERRNSKFKTFSYEAVSSFLGKRKRSSSERKRPSTLIASLGQIAMHCPHAKQPKSSYFTIAPKVRNH